MLNPQIMAEKPPTTARAAAKKPRKARPKNPKAPERFPAQAVTFKAGLIGFPEYREYGLMELPDPRLAQFRLLQSVDDAELAFLLLPLTDAAQFIIPSDLDKALEKIANKESGDACDSQLFAIVTLRKEGKELSVTANLRAPVIIDLKRKVGIQYVFANTDYDMRHPLR